MGTKEVCQALGLRPDYLADVLKREVAHQHRQLAAAALAPPGPELGGFGLQRIAGLLHLIGELEAEWERQNPEESYGAAEGLRVVEKEKGGGAKEATSAAAAHPPEEGSR